MARSGNGNFDKLNQSIEDLKKSIDKLTKQIKARGDHNNLDPFSRDSEGATARNVQDIKNRGKKLESYGKTMQNFGKGLKNSKGEVSALGKVISGLGKTMDKAGKIIKASNPIGWMLLIAETIAKVSKEIALADKRQQEFQNKRNTLFTQRNIELSNVEAEGYVDQLNTAYTKQMSLFNETLVKQQGQLQIENQKVIANASAQIGSVIGNINQTAWERLAAQTDINAEQYKLALEAGGIDENGNEVVGRVQQKERRARELADWNYQGRAEERAYQQRKVLLETEAENARLNIEDIKARYQNPLYESANYALGSRTTANEDKVGGDAKWNEKYGVNGGRENENRFEDFNLGTKNGWTLFAKGVTTALSPIVDLRDGVDASLIKSETTLNREITNATNSLNAQSAEMSNWFKVGTSYYENLMNMNNAVTDAVTDMHKTVIDTDAQIKKMFQKMAQTVEEWALNFQNMSFDTGISKGITNRDQLEVFSSYMNRMTTKLSRTYGLSAQDVLQLQQSYAPGGRNMIMNEDDLTKQAAFSKKYLGGDTQTAAELANNAEIFNMGVSGTVDMFSDIAKKLNKIGLDGRKYMKDMANNMKMANKFTFKDGVKGLANMAKWAQNVRFNMANVPQILDNIQSGGLENIITKAAKMQVLGGRYAMYADPLAMYYEAFNDPDALMKRFNNMTKGMGRFDKKTGNVTFGQVEQELMRAFAEASGQSIEDVRAQATYNIKKNKVTGLNQNLSKDQQQALVNKAYYENGEWMVNTIDGRKKNVKDVNEKNVGMVQGETYEDTMEKGMAKLVSFTELFTGNQEGNLSQLSQAITDSGALANNMNERLAKGVEDFNTKFDGYVQSITENMNKATGEYVNSLERTLKEHTEGWRNVEKAIRDESRRMIFALTDMYNATQYRTTGIGQQPISYRKYFDDEYEANAMSKPTKTDDAMIYGNGSSMTISANTIKPINDGLAKTNPDDSAIFAKTGGPFDTLFNGVFGRIDEIYNNLSNNSVVPSEPIGKSQFVSSDDAMAFGKGNPMTVSANELASQMGVNAMPTEITIKPVEVKLSGSVRLEANGQSVELMELLNKNPMLIRQLSQMISDEVGKSINGGRSISQYDYLRK